MTAKDFNTTRTGVKSNGHYNIIFNNLEDNNSSNLGEDNGLLAQESRNVKAKEGADLAKQNLDS